ncbi:PREDICTED: papilin-like [Nicrophorus vespilloides]|uniref:Papilin-like n=1 Tax=Nicrophorus vespilloides TaxID=110193 RepID=A0ABM1M517_NICVS|nr:PREDICTED: papilin-like [Nicrophorus vespilloides]XP_017769668.1 PREDICTED: papilin-like [Nicrophorus vespilloides]XP_017769669.1 PREDICTED: papilin-like [Nicrophorus vespilloides]
MKCYLSAVCVFSVLVALSCAAPMPQSDQSGGSNTRLQTTNIVEGINSKIRLLRQYCPQIFQVIDNVIQNVTSTAFRVIGRAVLQSGGLGGGSRSSGGGSTSKVTVVLPTFPPDEDYDDEEDTNEVGGSSSTTTTEASSAIESRLTATSDSPKESEATAVKVEPTTEVDGNPLKIVIETTSEDAITTTPSEIEDLITVDLPNSVDLNVSTGLNVDEAVSSIDKLIYMNSEEAIVSDVATSTTEAVPEVKSEEAIVSVDITAELITSNPIVSSDEVVQVDVTTVKAIDSEILQPVDVTKSDEVELSVKTSVQSDAVDATIEAVVTTETVVTTEIADSSDSKETTTKQTSDESIEISSATESVVASTEASSEDVKEISENEIGIEDNRINLFDTENIIGDETSTEMAPFTSSPSELSREKRDVRVVRAAEAQQSDDQETAASGGNGPNPSDDLSNVDADDADRDKRYLPFGGSFGGHASGGHAGGGSGNFLFDIIRLVAGSGATEESDEKDNSPAGPGGVAEIDVAKGADGYTEGVPGPITRLFVLANRGLANLVQDLILRLAQTSERIVNFKARLVTALI